MTRKRAFITGITGQDGAYLAKYLVDKEYEVFGAYRRSSSVNFWRIEELAIEKHQNLKLVEYDLTDASASIRIVKQIQPDEIYNLAAQSFVGVSFEEPLSTAMTTGIGALHLLEAVRIVDPSIRFYQASTSELFGKVQAIPQSETTPFYPRSPYGVAKLFAHWSTINYRESYDIFASTGILFNHESPLRGKEFVTRKITDMAAKIKLGLQECLELGNMDAKRDWGFAEEYVIGMHAILQHSQADDFVLATGRTSTVREFVTSAFAALDTNIAWEGADENEVGRDCESGKIVVKVNPKFYRPAEVELLIGDASKAKEKLGWSASMPLEELCRIMVEADLRRNRDGRSY